MLGSEQVQSVNDRLDSLLQLAGKASGAALLRRLSEDLARIDQSLTAAIASGARDVIRADSHILISVAGTIGAFGLSESARVLNSLAHEKAPLPAGLADAIHRDLAALRAFLIARQSRDRTPSPPPDLGLTPDLASDLP